MVTQITVIAEVIRNGQILNICLPTCLLRNLFEEIGLTTVGLASLRSAV